MKRWSIVGMLVVLLALSIQTTFAGGWAVGKLDAVPTNVEAGKPIEIGFMLLQHGQTPFKDGSPSIEIRTSDGAWTAFPAKAQGDVGHYVAAVTFPSAGDWQMRVNPAPFPVLDDAVTIPITVAPAGQAQPAAPAVAATQPSRSSALVWGLSLGLIVLAGFATWLVMRHKPRVEAKVAKMD